MVTEPSPEELDAYMHLTAEETARLVLWLLIEEAFDRQLAAYRSQPQNPFSQPVKGGEELLV